MQKGSGSVMRHGKPAGRRTALPAGVPGGVSQQRRCSSYTSRCFSNHKNRPFNHQPSRLPRRMQVPRPPR